MTFCILRIVNKSTENVCVCLNTVPVLSVALKSPGLGTLFTFLNHAIGCTL